MDDDGDILVNRRDDDIKKERRKKSFFVIAYLTEFLSDQRAVFTRRCSETSARR